MTGNENTIGIPLGTRLLRIVRTTDGWRCWIATRDFIHGTYLHLHNDGSITRVVVRVGEGDEIMQVRPPDNKE